jgi:hypothetical protein
MVKILNLTPHDVVINGKTFPPSGQVARVEEKCEIVRTISIDGIEIPIIRKTFGRVKHLPEQLAGEEETLFLVSILVAQAAKRVDVVAIGEAIRNERGQVIGAKSLALI